MGLNPKTRRLSTLQKIRQSNTIERIYRNPTPAEVAEFERFMHLDSLQVGDLQRFVSVYQPGAVLRTVEGHDVWINRKKGTPGGPILLQQLANFLDSCNRRLHAPFEAHVIYEMIHPFSDGNGRSGRMLWYWLMSRSADAEYADLGFLHYFYYQTLEHMQDDDDL